MKKKLLYLLLLVAGAAQAQDVTIPDTNFKNKLLQADTDNFIALDAAGNRIKIDVNNDGEIQQTEALLVYKLDVGLSNISSLAGLESFVNLNNLNFRHNQVTSLVLNLPNLLQVSAESNQLTSLDVTGSPLLESIVCRNNQLASLDVSLLSNLKTLFCNNNQLTTLNVLGLSNLEYLECSNNQLTVLDVATLTSLESLFFNYNQVATVTIGPLSNLTTLGYSGNTQMVNFDLSPYINLTVLYCRDLGLNSLDLTGFTSLTALYCSGNPLTSLITNDLTSLSFLECNNTLLTELDLSHSPGLYYLHVKNNSLLTFINLHNNGLIEYPFECQFQNNPNLQLMCVDEGEEQVMLSYFEFHEVVPPYISANCAGDTNEIYNSIAGHLTFDVNGNGCESSDPVAQYTKVKISDGTTEFIKYTNNYGDYLKYVGSGNFTITPEYFNDVYVGLPVSGTVNFADMDGSAYLQDFCIVPNGVQNDVEVVIVEPIPAVPGFDAQYAIVYRNNGNQLASGSLNFTYDDAVLDFVSAYPADGIQANGMVTWSYSNLQPFESRYAWVTVNVNSSTETPAVNIDDVLSFNAMVTAQDDTHPDDNSFDMSSVVVGSFDPNNIACLEGDTATPDAIGEYLHYVVNFENTGNANANFVVVTQQFNPDEFDVNSLQLISSTHNVATSINGSILEFRFEAINLAPNAMGNVVFKIKTQSSLQTGDNVTGQAAIVFDYNYGLYTNEAITTFEELLGAKDLTKDSNVWVYPNPAASVVTVEATDGIKSIEMYDIQGRLLQAITSTTTRTNMDISYRPAGVYLLKISTNKGVKVAKVIKN